VKTLHDKINTRSISANAVIRKQRSDLQKARPVNFPMQHFSQQYRGLVMSELETLQIVQSMHGEMKSLNCHAKHQRIRAFSAAILGKPYLVGALGEGAHGVFDQSPSFRLDAYDCVTYVNTVLALALSTNATNFAEQMLTLNYAYGDNDYRQRHHFFCVDWMAHNARIGIIKDITNNICSHEKTLVQQANTVIDRPQWYRKRTLKDIKLISNDLTKQQDKLELLQQHALHTYSEPSQIPYLPIEALVSVSGHGNESLLNQIPDTAIITIVRPNWQIRQMIGTPLNISHCGFAIRDENNTLWFRNASSINGKVHDERLTQYLYERIESPSIKGIGVLKVL